MRPYELPFRRGPQAVSPNHEVEQMVWISLNYLAAKPERKDLPEQPARIAKNTITKAPATQTTGAMRTSLFYFLQSVRRET